MAFVGVVGGLMIVTVAAIWATVKIIRYSLESGEKTVLGYVKTVWTLTLIFVAVVVVLETWQGLNIWTGQAIDFISQLP